MLKSIIAKTPSYKPDTVNTSLEIYIRLNSGIENGTKFLFK